MKLQADPTVIFALKKKTNNFNLVIKRVLLKDLNGLDIQLTKGNWEVTDFHGINSDIMKLYYTSTQDGSINRSLFVLDLELDKTTKLSKKIGNNKFSCVEI